MYDWFQMVEDKNKLVFFYHKNHNDQFNGTSVYLKYLLQRLSEKFHITYVEPDLIKTKQNRLNGVTGHYFLGLLKDVYLEQFRWLIKIFRKGSHNSPANTLLLVEDIYSAPIPVFISRIKRYLLIYRAADFGTEYAKSLFGKHRIDTLIYSVIRKIMEKILIHTSSLIICPSSSVRNNIVKKYPAFGSKIFVFPYVSNDIIGTNSNENDRESLSSRDNKINMLFLGDCRYPPNYYAAKYILNHLIPSLQDLKNRFTITIAGPNSNILPSPIDSNVNILGEVLDKESLMKNSQIGLAPLLTPGGLSMKVIDYLVHGLFVIATPEAAVGIVPNEQMKVVELQEFSNTIRGEIINESNNGRQDRTISKEVRATYMTDNLSGNLIQTIENLFKRSDN